MERTLCKYSLAWIGDCGTHGDYNYRYRIDPPVYAEPGELFCIEHLKERCKCGKQAIAQCDNTGMLVCGYPYCADCGRHVGCPYA